jgi:hypothetical protein
MQALGYHSSIPPTRRRPRAALVLLGVFGVIALGVGAVNLMFSRMLNGPQMARLVFDSPGWKTAVAPDASHNSIRLRMADSFLATQQPVGKSRDQIVQLLGEPDDTPYFREYDMVYYLGPERGPFPVDSEWLVLNLSDGVVSEAKLARD